MTCKHGFIGPCGECDGAGQVPEIFFHTTPKVDHCRDGADHDFQGWRDFPDGSGGEQICAKCGLGAMTWSLMVGP